MTSDAMLVAELKRLLSSLSDRGSRHLLEVETDLAQTNFLLSGAIEKLGASFLAMHAAIESQQEFINALLAGTAPTSEIVEKLKAGRNEIDRQVNAAVTGLQFQDMTSQLIGRTVARIDGLREVLAGIGASGEGIAADRKMDEVVCALNGINAVIEERTGKLDGALLKAVSQTHMESGDIELF